MIDLGDGFANAFRKVGQGFTMLCPNDIVGYFVIPFVFFDVVGVDYQCCVCFSN
jgi:hypothetical protein